MLTTAEPPDPLDVRIQDKVRDISLEPKQVPKVAVKEEPKKPEAKPVEEPKEEVKPAPKPEETPEPVPVPEPEPIPEPEPTPQPAPEPVPEPIPEPEPVPEPEPEPEPEPAQETAAISVEATAYVANCEGCSGVTKTGVDVRNTTQHGGKRVIAVDPAVIPLGSSVTVVMSDGTSFEATAQDVGSAIVGHRIDILVSSQDEAEQFGRQSAKVTVH